MLVLTSLFIAIHVAHSFKLPSTNSFIRRTSLNHRRKFEYDPSVGIEVVPRRFRKATKQLSTLGPASNTFEMIEKLFLSGADIFRLNFSHGEHAEKARLVDVIRAVEKKYKHPIAILGDLQGPKLRVGTFAHDKVNLVDGQTFTFDLLDEPGDAYRVKLPHTEILSTLRPGDILLVDDGKLKMKVIETTYSVDTKVTCEVINGGAISNRKGVNTPSIVLPISPLTPKDRIDLDFILTLDIDWVALSFVQKPDDIRELKSITQDRVKVMAKLEKPSAIKNLDEIVDLSDGIMVARGDLGVEMNPWDVPVIQKRIVETCKVMGKPVVIATQMMESMIDNPTPTRAEASDCATAIYDSSDAVMLSAESAAGRFPVESVKMQQLIINKVEEDEVYKASLDRFTNTFNLQNSDETTSAIVNAARQVSLLSKSKALIVFTRTGKAAVRLSMLRPTVPILAACYDMEVARYLALVWGVYSLVLLKPDHEGWVLEEEVAKACDAALELGFLDGPQDLVTVTAGLPFYGNDPIACPTNTLRVVSVENAKEEIAAMGLRVDSFQKTRGGVNAPV